MAKYLAKHRLVDPTPVSISATIRHALSGMEEWRTTAQSYWSSLWVGEPQPSYDELVNTLSASADFYERLDAQVNFDAAAVIARYHFPPPPRKRGSATAQQTYFSQIMTAVFVKHFGSTKDPLVAIVTNVAFDLSGEVGAETVRGRRRSRTGSR